jgi:2-dehydropantoate 2-reductase
VFGEIDGATGSERLASLVALFRSAGLAAEASEDIRTEVWAKLLGNACYNPVSLLTGSATDRMIDDPAVHALFETMMNETIAVGRALGIDVATRPAERIALTRKLGHVKTSMLQDVEAGKAVELDAILGAVLELAHRCGVPCPANANVYVLARLRARTLGLLDP